MQFKRRHRHAALHPTHLGRISPADSKLEVTRRVLAAGNAVIDGIITATEVLRTPSHLSFAAAGSRTRTLCAVEPHHGDKCTLQSREDGARLVGLARESLPGGGALNSIAAAVRLNRRVHARSYTFTLVTESGISAPLRDLVHAQGVEEFIALGGTPPPQNFVIVEPGHPGRYILRSPGTPRLAPDWRERCASLEHRRPAAVLINSCKTTELATTMINLARNARAPLFAVLAPGLPAEFRVRRLLPAASVAIANLAEFHELCAYLHVRCPEDESTVRPEREMILPLRQFAVACRFQGDLVITLGARGCVLLDGGSGDIHHVQSSAAISAGIHATLLHRPALANGAGDAFAGYALLSWLKARGATPSPILAACRDATLFMAHRFGMARCAPSEVLHQSISQARTPRSVMAPIRERGHTAIPHARLAPAS